MEEGKCIDLSAWLTRNSTGQRINLIDSQLALSTNGGMLEYTPTKVSDGLNGLRKSGTLCDVILVVENQEFPAHKIVLSVFSPYFEAIFCRDFTEAQKSSVTLKDAQADVMNSILDYAYTGSIEINVGSVQKILQIANYLQAQPLFWKCHRFLEEHVNAGNCVFVWNLADFYSCAALKEKARQYMIRNFTDVCVQDAFLDQNVEFVVDLVKGDLAVPNEEFVFDAVMRWVKHKPERKSSLPKVMPHVRGGLLSTHFLGDRMRKETGIWSSPECVQQLFGMMCNKDPRSAPVLEVLIVCGSEAAYTDDERHLMYMLELWTGKLRPLPKNPSEGRAWPLVTDRKSLEIYTEADGMAEAIWKFDFTSNEWKKVISFSAGEKRSFCPGGCRYAFELDGFFLFYNCNGGVCGPDCGVLQRRYDVLSKTWTSVTTKHRSKYIKARLPVKGYVYELFVSDYDEPDNIEVRCYNPSRDTWSTKASSPKPFKTFKAAVIQNNICVVGKAIEDAGAKTQLQVYDVASDSWEWGFQLNQYYKDPAAGALLVWNGRLTYIDQSRFPVLDIECYFPEEKCWKIFSKTLELDPKLIKDEVYFEPFAVLAKAL